MLKTWTKILPFFFIEWYSKKYCERYYINLSRVGTAERLAVSPFRDCYFVVKKKQVSKPLLTNVSLLNYKLTNNKQRAKP